MQSSAPGFLDAAPPPMAERQDEGRWWPAPVVFLVAVAAALAAALLWQPEPGHDDVPTPARARRQPAVAATAAPAHGHGAGARPALLPEDAPRTPQGEPALPDDATALHAQLREDAVSLPSGVVIERIERDRPWVCAGEPVQLAARVGGAALPGVQYRWIWATPASRAGLHPGQAMHWQAPATPGRHRVHFQACQDLGGRRVGVLAAASVDIEVRACDAGQAQALLRIAAVQGEHGAFSFRAVYRGDQNIEALTWDFGDGTIRTVTMNREATALGGVGSPPRPQAEGRGRTGGTPPRQPAPATPRLSNEHLEHLIDHAYAAAHELGPHELMPYTVTADARLADGTRVRAMTHVQVRGRPPRRAPPRVAVEVDIARGQPRADGPGWQSRITVRPPAGTTIVWDRLERVTKRAHDRVDMTTLAWDQVITVDEPLADGGFRGRVTVEAAPSEADPVTQVIDFLYGHDPAGDEVMVSWSPYKR